LSTPVIEPDAVLLQEVGVLAVAVVAVESSFLAQDPISATMPTIKTIQNSNFFINYLFHLRLDKYRVIPAFI
jgi:hypothetical protein